jgi:hypothetical protein
MVYSHIEENFNPGLGFVNNPGVEQLNMGTEYTWRPTDGLFRSILAGLNFERSDFIVDGRLQSKRRTLRMLELETRTGDEITTRHHWRDELLIDDFEISTGVVIPAGRYSFHDINLELQTGDQRKVWGTFDYRNGPFFGGDRVQTEVGVSWRPSGRFFASMSYETNDIELPQGNFVTRLAQYRTEVVFSPRISWVTLVQYDNVSEVIGFNSRVHWIPQAGREAFLVLNHNVMDFDRDNSFESLSADISVKFNYTFRF